MRKIFALWVMIGCAVTAWASEGSFDRTLTVKGQATLIIETGSGHIHLVQGSQNQIHILGKVKSSGWGESEPKVQDVVNHPPIEQTGDIIRVGKHHGRWNNISIDYEVQVPSNVLVEASSGSGDIEVDGVGQNAQLETGSGSIHGHGLQGTLKVETGSGNIDVDLTGVGDVKAETGSGSIRLHGVQGSLNGETGSGNIYVEGSPTHNWKLQTGSGSVELQTGKASFELDAETGSGGIHVEQQFQAVGNQEKDHVRGKVNGGGPLVKIETGSGNVRVK